MPYYLRLSSVKLTLLITESDTSAYSAALTITLRDTSCVTHHRGMMQVESFLLEFDAADTLAYLQL